MPSSIYFTDEQKAQIVEAAIKCGFRVSRGRGSQLALFVVQAANNACTQTAGITPPNQQLSTPQADTAKGDQS